MKMKLKENISLSKHTSWHIGGPARYFVSVKNTLELVQALKVAQTKQLPYFILGNGSNVLVNDKGFNGLVIVVNNRKVSVRNNEIYAEAGVLLSELVNLAQKRGLSGLEWAVGIPGTLGGAIRGNAGAFSLSTANIVNKVNSINEKHNLVSRQLSDLKFGYRDSIFKNNNEIITSVKLKFQKSDPKKINENILKYLSLRQTKQPTNLFSAGSVFKNPTQGPAAAFLIDQCNLKGKQVGQAKVSFLQPNFIINLGQASSDDIVGLIKLVKEKVYKKFNIKLEEEIVYLGF